jgi:hypothetical protein
MGWPNIAGSQIPYLILLILGLAGIVRKSDCSQFRLVEQQTAMREQIVALHELYFRLSERTSALNDLLLNILFGAVNMGYK